MIETREKIAIRANGEDLRIASEHTVTSLLAELGVHPAAVVIELNREILRQERFAETKVREGDVLEVVHFVGGG